MAVLTALLATLTAPEAIFADVSAIPDPKLAIPGARPAAFAACAPVPEPAPAFAPFALAI